MNKTSAELARPMFDPLVGSEFRLRIDSGASIPLELVESTPLPPVTERSDLPIRTDPFCLVFKGDSEAALAQRIYELHHPDLGSFEVFLVPIGFGEYEAVFN